MLSCFCAPSVKLKYFSSPRVFALDNGSRLPQSARGAEQAKIFYPEVFMVLRTKSNVALLAAFFPSSGIHWGLAVHFLLEPLPVRLGIAGLPFLRASDKEAAAWSSDLSKCSGQAHTHSLILNFAYHTETNTHTLSVRNRPLKSMGLIFLGIMLSDQLWAWVQSDAHNWIPAWHFSSLCSAGAHCFWPALIPWLIGVYKSNRQETAQRYAAPKRHQGCDKTFQATTV